MAGSVTLRRADVLAYMDHLRSLSFVERAELRPPQGREIDPVLEVVARRKTHAFDVGLLRTHLSMPEVERWIGRARAQQRKRPLLLLAPYVSRPMGVRLREAGVQYIDQAGNMHLALGESRSAKDTFVVLVEGKRGAPTTRADAAWRAPAYQVLLALLVTPDLLAAPVRTIAAQAGASTSPVLQVRTKLLQANLAIARGGRWQWTPHGRKHARELWLHGYHATLRSHLLIGRYRSRAALAPDALESAVENALRGHVPVRWGGAAAAHRLNPYYRGDRTVVHVDGPGLTAASLAGTLRMLPDPEGPLIVMRIPGPCALESPHPSTVTPLLAWAELLEEGHDRASEAAEHLAAALLEDTGAQ